MPTGYTAGVVDGRVTEFREFAMKCARAFGALIEMRDDALDAEIPEEFTASRWHIEHGEAARRELERLTAMSSKERLAFATAKKAEALKSQRDYVANIAIENSRLNAMKEKVLVWEPPSPDHEEMKRFMLDQLEISVNPTTYSDDEIKRLEAKEPLSFYSAAKTAAERSLAYHAEGHEKEIARAAERTRWIKQLRESLHAEKTIAG